MDFNHKIRLFTEDDPIGEPVVQYAQRSAAINHLSPSVCDDFTLTQNCRIDTTGNVSALIPEVGNIVYANFSGSTKFNGNNLYYAIELSVAAPGDFAYICQIGTGINLGKILSISTTCEIPA